MKKEWLTYDLQFFADGESADEGAEETGNAEQSEVDESEEAEEEEGDSEEEDEDRDSIYAAARRRAESEAKVKYDRAQSERDQYFARICAGKVNPETNMPITNEAEYIEALKAQERVNVQNELQQKGVDPAVIDKYIANSPQVIESQRMLAALQEREVKSMVEEDIKTIMALDKSFESEDDLVTSDAFRAASDLCRKQPGLRLADAYKLVNFEALRSAGVKAAKQAAVNEAKGKGHLKASPNAPTGKGALEIPEAEMAKWKKFYPDKSVKELNALYAKVHTN